MKQYTVNENILLDLIKCKQQVDAVKRWVQDNEHFLGTMNILSSIWKILYQGGNGEES